jgi:phenylacetate-CoA ligase
MDPYKHICRHIVIPMWARWERSPYLKHLKYLKESQYYPEERVREIQWSRIKRLLNHAYKNTRLYNEIFDEAGIHPNDIRSFEDYDHVPILKKEDVIRRSEDLIAPNVEKYIPFLTSGSTGKPLKGWRDKECSEFKRACGRRSELWAGYELGERIYCLYGNPEKELEGLRRFKALVRRKMLTRTEILDLLNLTDEAMVNFVSKMRVKPPSLLWGHAHALFQLASFMEKQELDGVRPKGMYSAGMILHDYEREKVEEVFDCKLQDRYGTEELGLLAAECKSQEGLHVNTDAHFIEFIGRGGERVTSGERGNVVVTDLTNYVMPFIRYDLEDIAIPSARRCSCGRTQPLIEKVEGRVADFLISPDGRLVSGISLTDHFAGQIPGVSQMQIVQEKLDFLRIRVVRDQFFDESSRQSVSKLIHEFFGERMKFEFEFVQEIPREPSGKYRFTVCMIDK